MQRADLRNMFSVGGWNSLFGRKRQAIAGPAGTFTGGGCSHTLGRHLLRTCRSTQSYPDGGLRLPEHRGGRLVVDQAPCVWAPRHAGAHKTADGRTWS